MRLDQLEGFLIDRRQALRQIGGAGVALLGGLPASADAGEPDAGPRPRVLTDHALQWWGRIEGGANIGTGLNVLGVGRWNAGGAFMIEAPRSGGLRRCQFNITTRNAAIDEKTKSRKAGDLGHGFPASWLMRFRLYRMSGMSTTGSPLVELDWTHKSLEGHPYEDSRLIVDIDLGGTPVTIGDRLAFCVMSRDADPASDHVVLNGCASRCRPPGGLNPPRRVNLFYGDMNQMCVMQASGPDFELAPHTNSEGDCLHGLAIEYTDGVQWGGTEGDSTASAMRTMLGEAHRVRQKYRKPYWRKLDRLWLAVGRNASPQAPLAVRVTGGAIDRTIIIPAAQIQECDFAGNGTLTNQVFALERPLIFAADTVYTVELSSPGTTAGGYIIQGVRPSRGVFKRADARNMDPPPAPGDIIAINSHNGSGERSSDGGGSWQPAGWPSGKVDLPIAFELRSYAESEGGL